MRTRLWNPSVTIYALAAGVGVGAGLGAIAFQYLSAPGRAELLGVIEAAGERASLQAPFAWLRFGPGGDQAARQDMFPSRVASYNDDPLLGTKATTADSNFDRGHPLYRLTAELSRLRKQHAALRRGRQVVRNHAETPGLFAVSRIDPQDGQEIVVAFNTSDQPLVAQVQVDFMSRTFEPLHGSCSHEPTAPGSLQVSLAALDFVICAAGEAP